MCTVQPIDIQYTYRLLLNIVDAVCYQSAVMVDDIICFSNSSKIFKKRMVSDLYSCADVWNVYECALCCCKCKPTDAHTRTQM